MADEDDDEWVEKYDRRVTQTEELEKDLLDKLPMLDVDHINRNAAYQIRPSLSEKFKSTAVKEIINMVLNDQLRGKIYSEQDSEEWTKNIVANVKSGVKELGLRRYKIIVQTILGQNKGSGVKIGARCLWDADTDNCASDSFLSDTIFCCVIVFGIYSY